MLDCWTGIDFLHTMQDLRETLPDFISTFFTVMSSPAVYMAIPIVLGTVLYWVIDKRKGEFMSLCTIFAYYTVNFIKFIVRQPRPWVIDPTLDVPSESARATGYSFPSGHSAIVTAGFGIMAYFCEKIWLKILFIAVAVLVLFARLYLGAHTPLDILAGIALAILIIFINAKLLQYSYTSERNYNIIAVIYMIVAAAMFASILMNIDSDYDNVMAGAGFTFGIVIARVIEHKFVSYEIPEMELKKKILVCLVGLIVIGAILVISLKLGTIPGFIGSILAMLWAFAGYPYILKTRIF